MSHSLLLVFGFIFGFSLYVLGRFEQRATVPGATLTATIRANYAALVNSFFLYREAVNGVFQSSGQLVKDANGCGEFLCYQLTLGGVTVYSSRVDCEMVDDDGASHSIDDDTFLALEPHTIGVLRLPLIVQLDLAASFLVCMFTDDGIDCGWLMKRTLDRFPTCLVKPERFHSFKPGWGNLLLVERAIRPGDRGMLSQAGAQSTITTASPEELPICDTGRYRFALGLSYAGTFLIILSFAALSCSYF